MSYNKTIILKNAIASVEMEGYKLSDFNKKMCQDVINKKISKEQCVQQIITRRKAVTQ